MQKIIEIEQHLLFFIDFLRVPKHRVQPIANILFKRLSLFTNEVLKENTAVNCKLKKQKQTVFQG